MVTDSHNSQMMEYNKESLRELPLSYALNRCLLAKGTEKANNAKLRSGQVKHHIFTKANKCHFRSKPFLNTTISLVYKM